jgi:hypothetical protein
MNTVTDQVPLSAGRVSSEKVPTGSGDRSPELGEESVPRPKMARVVDEAGVLDRLGDRPRARRLEQARKLRATAHGIDHQVGTQLLSGLGPHAAHVRDTVVGAHHELADRDAAAQLEPALGLGGAGEDVLEHRPAGGDRREPLISVARCAIADRARHLDQEIEPERAGCLERPHHIRQRLIEHNAASR